MASDKKATIKLWERWWDRGEASWVRKEAPNDLKVTGSRDAFLAGYRAAMREKMKDKKP